MQVLRAIYFIYPIINDDFLNKLCEKYDTVFYSNIIEISQISFCWVCKGARIFIFMNLLMPMALIIARVHSI